MAPTFGDDVIIRTDVPWVHSGPPDFPPVEEQQVARRSNCRSGCPTQDHRSWGECARSANLKVAYCGIGGGDATVQKKWDTELSLYRSARAQGIQPDGTTTKKVVKALEASNAAGAAYGRDFNAATSMGA